MSDQQYTLTLYIAPPKGRRIHPDTQKELQPSTPGHVYYAIQAPGEKKKAYGFSPIKSEMDGPGHGVRDEHKIYANPAYMRTVAITKEQYEKLKAFGEASVDKDHHASRVSALTGGKFSTANYNAANNSCVDYVFHALRYSGVFNYQKYKLSNELTAYGVRESKLMDDDGKLNVLFNAEIFNQVKGLKLINLYDNTKEAIKKAPLPFNINVQNEHHLPENTLALSPKAMQFAQTCEEKLVELCKERGITSDNPQDFKNIAMALTAEGIKKGMTKVDKMDIDPKTFAVHILSFEPHARLTSVMANDAVNIPAQESMKQICQTEEQQNQQRQMAQLEQRNAKGLSIG